MSVNSLRIVSECATTVTTAVSVYRDLADVQITDVLCDRSVSIQVHAADRVSGESLTPFCNLDFVQNLDKV